MPPQRPRGRGSRLGPAEADSAAMRRLLAARARQAKREARQPEDPPDAENTHPQPPSAPPAQSGPVTSAEPAEATGEEELPGEEVAPGEEEGEAPADNSKKRAAAGGRLLVPALLGVLTVVLGALAAWFGTEADGLNGATSAQNTALTDVSQTSIVTRQVAGDVGALFSYNYAAPGPTASAARADLTGPAVKQYAALFGQVSAEAPKDHLIVTTSVTNDGVEMLDGGTARLLVFAIEADRKAGSSQSSSAGAMLAVNAVLSDGTWKIEDIDTF